MLRTVDSERKPGETVVQTLHRAIKLAAVMANLCPFLVLFWASKKVQETGRWALSRTFNGDRCSSTLKI
ncbi:hypothetical protein COR50_16510 [Chitinophaga caeni]|uniref:Uncharacterized protein n=1 Tax=Chitinophaga caeni TaxID=2029983 RepID=A0A291QXG8_9BACT|nr:hypothetical protein COR50_16510 [Chitinophaga caeni]